MARFLSLAVAACALTLFVTGCESADFATGSIADPDSTTDASGGDVTTDGTSDASIDTTPPDGAPPPCATPPCSCEDPTPTRCGAACVNTKTDVEHCGSCVESCTKVDHGSPVCTGGTCSLSCDTAFHACGKLCVKNTLLSSCGTSCSPCPPAGKNASATCDGTKCGIACYAGFADCNGGTDGCEADLSLNTNCGGCGVTCSGSTPFCAPKGGGGFACASGCTGSLTNCSGVCVDITSNPNNCGGCGSACPVVAHARATCTSSICGFVCDSGYHACGGACVADDLVTSCGPTSCTACPAPPHATATCDGTKCGFTCVAGFKDCNGLPGDGCEADLSSPLTCGACGSKCPVPPHGTATCSAGVCGFTCTGPWIPLDDRCALFGGAYESVAKGCGSGTGSCPWPNPFTKACTCPAGFVEEHAGASLECDESQRNDLVICNAPAGVSTFPTAVDWGGAYEKTVIACDPITDCIAPNPYTGTCSCPTGTNAIVFDSEDTPPERPCGIVTGGPPWPPPAPPTPIDGGVVGGSAIMTNLVFCGTGIGGTSTPPITFFGAFERMDDGSCLVKNPMTSACSCPTGSAERLLRVVPTPGKPGNLLYCVPG